MSDEPLINVAFNEPRCGRFKLYDNGKPDEHTYTLPQSLWRALNEAKKAIGTAKANHRAALADALNHIKAKADPDDDIQDFQIDKDGIYW